MTSGWSAPGYAEVAEIVRARTGLVFGPARVRDAESVIGRAVALQPTLSLSQYPGFLERHPAALDDLVAELTVGETHFFRHSAQLEFLESVVLPEIRERRGREHVVRAWSAGCGSGEEAYTIAILLARESATHQAHQAFVLGSDVSRPSLAKAREATYRRWSLRGVGEEARARYFQPVGDRFRLEPQVKCLVRFEHLNLALDVYPSFAAGAWGMDVIFCRNVLIYLDRPTILAIGRRLFDTLADGGWLILGPSDPRLDESAPYEVIVTPVGIYYRRGVASRPMTVSSPLPTPDAPTAPVSADAPIPVAPRMLEPAALAPRLLVEPRAAAPSDRVRAAIAEARGLAGIGDVEGALRVADAALALPSRERGIPSNLSAELHFLRGVLHLSIAREEQAIGELRSALFLDPTLAAAHFVLGTALARRGSVDRARRSFRNARDLAAARPPDEPIAFGDGEQAGRFAAVAASELAALEPQARGRE